MRKVASSCVHHAVRARSTRRACGPANRNLSNRVSRDRGPRGRWLGDALRPTGQGWAREDSVLRAWRSRESPICGMNFDHMPELHWFAGYPLALALMVITSITLGQALISQSSYADLLEQLLHDFEHRYTLWEIRQPGHHRGHEQASTVGAVLRRIGPTPRWRPTTARLRRRGDPRLHQIDVQR